MILDSSCLGFYAVEYFTYSFCFYLLILHFRLNALKKCSFCPFSLSAHACIFRFSSVWFIEHFLRNIQHIMLRELDKTKQNRTIVSPFQHQWQWTIGLAFVSVIFFSLVILLLCNENILYSPDQRKQKCLAYLLIKQVCNARLFRFTFDGILFTALSSDWLYNFIKYNFYQVANMYEFFVHNSKCSTAFKAHFIFRVKRKYF